jgi:hypothetical protein
VASAECEKLGHRGQSGRRTGIYNLASISCFMCNRSFECSECCQNDSELDHAALPLRTGAMVQLLRKLRACNLTQECSSIMRTPMIPALSPPSISYFNPFFYGIVSLVAAQILPNDELFGCIVFRGMDIKDLHVHETPIEEDSHLHANNTNSLPPPPVPPAGALTATAPSPPKSPKQSHQQQQQQHATTTRRPAGGRGAGGARQHQQHQQQQQGGESEGAEGGGRGHGNAPRGGRYQPPHKVSFQPLYQYRTACVYSIE